MKCKMSTGPIETIQCSRDGILGILALILSLWIVPIPSLGSGADEVHQKVENILVKTNLAGPERANALHKTLHSLTDPELFAVVNSLGAERFLRQSMQPDAIRGEASPNPAGETEGSIPSRYRQMQEALRSPQQRERLTRRVANYLLNTSK